MADTKQSHEQRNPNQTMQREQAKAEVSGNRQDERDKLDQERHQKSGIGGGQPSSQTGQAGTTRNELDQNKKEPAGQQR
jgi:hypothetical protein